MSQDHNSDGLPLPPPPPSAGKRNMKVIALAVVCIVLAASIVGLLLVNPPNDLKAQLNDKENVITGLQTQVENLTSQLSSANTDKANYENQVTSLNTELTNLTSQLNSAANIMTMQATQTLVSSKSITTTNSSDVFNNALPYPGYVVVQATSNSTNTYVQTIYSVSGVNYNQNVTVGKSGTASFPVLMTTSPNTVEIRIGSTDKIPFNATVTIIYHY